LASEIVPEIDAIAALLACGDVEFEGEVVVACCARVPADHTRSISPRNIQLDFIIKKYAPYAMGLQASSPLTF
jgi:hypothetical protein